MHVDDVCQSTHDLTDSRVASTAIENGVTFATEATAKGLVIASKSVVVASSLSLARKIAVGLNRHGLQVKAQQRAEDLGVVVHSRSVCDWG